MYIADVLRGTFTLFHVAFHSALTRQAVALPATFHPVGGHKVAPPQLSQLLHELETPNLADG